MSSKIGAKIAAEYLANTRVAIFAPIAESELYHILGITLTHHVDGVHGDARHLR